MNHPPELTPPEGLQELDKKIIDSKNTSYYSFGTLKYEHFNNIDNGFSYWLEYNTDGTKKRCKTSVRNEWEPFN